METIAHHRSSGRALHALVFGAGMACSSIGFAQTCSYPLSLPKNQIVTGDTCTASDSVPFLGGIPLPHPDVVYTFYESPYSYPTTSVIAWPTNRAFNVTAAVISGSCSSGSFIEDVADATDDGVAYLPEYLDAFDMFRRYYVIVTGDPALTSGATCGGYRILRTSSVITTPTS